MKFILNSPFSILHSVFIALVLSGCILGPIGAANLSPEQIDAMKKYNDGNLYICGIVEGGSRNGNVVFILLPKDAPLTVQFSADCHIK